MKVLLDANLSWRLVKKLTDWFPDCLHVTRTELSHPAPDEAIWAWAKANDYLIVTNDDDYYRLADTQGFPPKVVLLRMGNQSSASALAVLISHYADIQALHESDEYGVLELF
jgi:predicted nuclease of predicted toxin-antitoxin system